MRENEEFKYMHQLDDSRLSNIDVIRTRRETRWPLVAIAFLGSLALGALGPMAIKLMAQDAAPMAARIIEAEEISTLESSERMIKAAGLSVGNSKANTAKSAKANGTSVKARLASETSKKAPPAKGEKVLGKGKGTSETKPANTLEKTPAFAMSTKEPKLQSSLTDPPALDGTDLSAEYVQATINALLINPSDNLDPTDVNPESVNNDAYLSVFNASYNKQSLAACKRRCLLRTTDANGKKIFAVIDGPNFAEVLIDHKGTINLTGQSRWVKGRELFMVQNITFNLSPDAPSVASKLQKKSKAPLAKPASFKKKSRLKMKGFEDLRSVKPSSL